MPKYKFFANLGLYTIPGFVSEQTCEELMEIMAASPSRPGVTIAGAGESKLDETRRSVGDVKVPEAAAAATELKRSMLDLRPDLERHFKMPLEWGGEGPDYLIYKPGDFFKPHVDDYEDSAAPNSIVLRRRVAVLLFLNSHSREHRENCFGGGLLNLYGLLDEPRWRDCAFGLEPEAGLLVAFPSGLVHEVTPITFGERYAVLTAFHAPAVQTTSSQ